MRVIRASSKDEMVAVFLGGELVSSRFGPTIRAALARVNKAEALVTAPDLDDERENTLRREILDAVRDFVRKEGLFAGFPDDVCWERVALGPNEVLAIRYIDYDYWVELSDGSRRPTDAARRISEGVTSYGVPSDGFLEIASALATSEPPVLIVVGGSESDLVVLEGHARLTGFALRPDVLPAELEVLLGRSPRINEWALW